jgi:hypothetical protein
MASSNPVPLYGVAIHHCIDRGDLDEMKRLSAEAETHLGEVKEALDKLNAEIAQAEG